MHCFYFVWTDFRWQEEATVMTKGQNPLHEFPHSKSITSSRLPCCVTNKSVTSPQHKQQVCSKSVTCWLLPRITSAISWHGQKFIVSVVSCHFPDSSTSTCCQLVAELLATYWHAKIVCHVTNKSATSWQLLRLRWHYGETCLMDFWHNRLLVAVCI